MADRVQLLQDFLLSRKDKIENTVKVFSLRKSGLMAMAEQGKLGVNLKAAGEKTYRIVMELGLPEGAGIMGENSLIPDALSNGEDYCYLYLSKYGHTFGLTGSVKDLVSGSEALRPIITKDLKKLAMARFLNHNAFIHGDGTGILAYVTAANNTTKVVSVLGTQFLRVGMRLNGYDSVPALDCSNITVKRIIDGTSFEAEATDDLTAVDANTRLYHAGTDLLAADYVAPWGIGYHVDDADTTWQGVNRTGKSYLKAKVLNGSVPGTPEALTLERMRRTLRLIDNDPTETDPPSIIYVPQGVADAYTSLLKSLNQPTEIMPAKDGYPAGIKFVHDGREIPMVTSRFAAPNTMFFLAPKSFILYTGPNSGFETEGGGMLKMSATKHEFKGFWREYVNFGCRNPMANARLNDITEVA